MDGSPGTNQVAMVERWLLVCPCRRLSVCVSIGLSFHYIYLFRIGLLNENTHDSLQL